MYSPLRIDVTWGDLAYGLGACILPPAVAQRMLGRGDSTHPVGDGMELLSVRSGFDLVLTALDLPRGSEVLMSALTIPDMVGIVEAHGLIPVPIDIDPETLVPAVAAMEAALTERTRAAVIAQLFGAWSTLAPHAAFCRRHGLALVEDCAQAFLGPQFTGEPGATASLFSFGPIKRSTALGGALAYVRDGTLRDRIQELHGALPTQGRWPYARRIVKFMALHLLSGRTLYAIAYRALRVWGTYPDVVLRGAVKGFPGTDLLGALRRQPSLPLLLLLRRRLRRFSAGNLKMHSLRYARELEQWRDAVPQVGHKSDRQSYWVLPVRCRDPEAMVRTLRRHGFDATRAASSLQAVGAPPGRPGGNDAASALLRSVVYLPCYLGMPQRDLERMLHTFVDAERAAN